LLPLLLANGITGVRDMGGDLETSSPGSATSNPENSWPHRRSGPWLQVVAGKRRSSFPWQTPTKLALLSAN